MGFLSAALPGVRDFRTPFVVGALWTTVGVLWAWKFYEGEVADVGFVRNVNEIISPFPDGVKLGVLSFVIYLIGLVAKGVQDWFASLRLRRLFAGLFERASRWLSRIGILSESRSKDYLADTARERFAEYPSAVREVAHRILLEEYDLADVILASRSPEQYQEYDRWRSEAEFRNGVWIPLLLSGVGIGFLAVGYAAWLILAGVGAISVVLKLQGVVKRRQADERLASAVYFDLATTPLFDAFLRDMGRRSQEHADDDRKRAATDADQIGWAVEFLKVRGLDHLIRALLLHSPQGAEMKRVIEAVSWEARRYIDSSSVLQDLNLVAYGGVEWSEELGRVANSEVRVDRISAASERINENLASQVEFGDLQVHDLAEAGVLACLQDREVLRIKGDATDDEWLIAVRIEDSKNGRYASRPEAAYLQE